MFPSNDTFFKFEVYEIIFSVVVFSHRISVSVLKKSTGKSDYDLRVFPQGFALTPMLRTVIPLKAKGNNSRAHSTNYYGFKTTTRRTF